MEVTRLLYKVLDRIIRLVGWFLCIPLRIQYDFLRWINPKLVETMMLQQKKYSRPSKIEYAPDVQALKRQHDQAVNDKNYLGQKNRDLRHEVSQLKVQCERLTADKKRLSGENGGLRQKLRSQRESEIPNQVAELQQQLADMTTDRANAEANLKSVVKHRDDLQRQVQELSDKLKEKEEILKQQSNTKHHTETDIKVKQKQVDDLKTDYNNIKDKLKKVQDELQATQIEKEKLTKDIIQKDELIAQHEIDVDELEAKLHSTEESKEQINTVLQGVEEGVRSLKQEITRVNYKLQEEITKYEAAESENQQLTDTIKEVESERAEAITTLQQTEIERDEAVRRLSEMMSLRLRDNNPNVVDLNDKYRPTKLAEMMNELYDNEWTDLLTYLEDNWTDNQGREFPDLECIEFLLNILMETYTFCQKKVQDDWIVGINKILWTADTDDDKELVKKLKDARKKNSLKALPGIQKQCVMTLQQTLQSEETTFSLYPCTGDMKNYVDECIKLCWLMSLQDPPVCLKCDRWESKQADQFIANDNENNNKTIASCQNEKKCDQKHDKIKETYDTVNSTSEANVTETNLEVIPEEVGCTDEDERQNVMINTRHAFDKNSYKEFTKRGQYIEYIVWPKMYLHENGPLLNKGVAQCYN